MHSSGSRPWPRGEWRGLLAESSDTSGELLDRLQLDPACRGSRPAMDAERQFPVRVPRGFLERIRPGDADDPLLRQVLPTAAEGEGGAGFSTDPLGEVVAPPVDGVLRKYHGRALVMVTPACAVHCRYCFRRHFPYADLARVGAGWDAALARIRDDTSLTEVILSGGDPLTVPDDRLGPLVHHVAAIAHVKRVRIHTRVPVVLPQRVDEGLVEWLCRVRLPVVVVVHVNHPAEIDPVVRRAFAVLRGTDVTLLNQSVLLRGVNDSAGVLVDLSEKLLEAGALPYYLHLLDRVQGASHFEVPEDEAVSLMEQLRARLPGYLVPRLVREVAGAPAKVPVELR